MEGVRFLEGPDEDGHFSHESAESRETEGGKAGDDVADAEVGHDFHESAHFPDVAGVRAPVDHADEGEEEGGHQAVGEHLHDGSRHGRLVEHEDGKEYEPAVADGGVGVDVFQVGLHDGGVGPVYDADAREDDEYP